MVLSVCMCVRARAYLCVPVCLCVWRAACSLSWGLECGDLDLIMLAVASSDTTRGDHASVHIPYEQKNSINRVPHKSSAPSRPTPPSHPQKPSLTCIVPMSHHSIIKCVFQHVTPAPPPKLPSHTPPPPRPPAPPPPPHAAPPPLPTHVPMLLQLPPALRPPSGASSATVNDVNSCTMCGCRRLAFSHDSYSWRASSAPTTPPPRLSPPLQLLSSPLAATASGAEAAGARCGGVVAAAGGLREHTWITLTATTLSFQTPGGGIVGGAVVMMGLLLGAGSVCAHVRT